MINILRISMLILLAGCSYQEMARMGCSNDGIKSGTDEFQNCVTSRVAYLEGDLLLSAQKECLQQGKKEQTVEYEDCVNNRVVILRERKISRAREMERLRAAGFAFEHNINPNFRDKISHSEAKMYMQNPYLYNQLKQQERHLDQMNRINSNLNQLNYQIEQNRRKRYYRY